MLKTLNSLGILLFFVLLCLAIGQLSAFYASEDAYRWFDTLNKPQWTPPNFLFPLAWTLSYLFMAFAAWFVWRPRKLHYRFALLFWVLQLIINACWTPLFFGHRQIFYSLIMINLLWVLVLITTALFYRHSKFATFLMSIYLIFISFADVLNLMIWRMN